MTSFFLSDLVYLHTLRVAPEGPASDNCSVRSAIVVRCSPVLRDTMVPRKVFTGIPLMNRLKYFFLSLLDRASS